MKDCNITEAMYIAHEHNTMVAVIGLYITILALMYFASIYMEQ